MDKNNDSKVREREKISSVSLKRDGQEISEALTTDLKKMNKNKFFFNLEGEKEDSSQD